MGCFHFIPIHPVCFTMYVLFKCWKGPVTYCLLSLGIVLWFWYLIESSRDLSVLISVICCSDLKFFDDFWYKVNEIQENKVRMLLDRTLISPPFSLTFQAFIYSSSPMFLDAFLTLRSASFPLCGQGLILFLYLSHPLLLSFWFSFSVIIFPAVSRLLLFLYQPQHPQPLNPG